MNETDLVSTRLIELAEGYYVERDVLNVVEKIQEYDPHLKVKYLDPASGHNLTEAPYKVVETCPDGQERVVFSTWTLDETVLQRIYAADKFKNDILGQLDTKNALAKRNEKQRYEDQRLEAMDMVKHVLKSPKGRYTFKNTFDDSIVTLDDSAPYRKQTTKAVVL